MINTRRWAFTLVVLMAVGVTAGVSRGLLVDMAGHWSAPLVVALEAKGIVSGDLSGRFNPEAPLTRSQLAKLLVVALGNEEEARILAGFSSRFSDVPPGHWARGFIESLAEAAITEGYPDGTFRPAESVTRAQMAVFLVRAARLEAQKSTPVTTRFSDDHMIPDWAFGSVYTAAAAGLLTGYTDGSFRPAQPMTRSEGAVAVLRLTEFRGSAYHLTGTLLGYDPITRQGMLRDAVGQEHAFRMDENAVYYRSGIQVSPLTLRRFDQVWLVEGPSGQGLVLEARFADLMGSNVEVSGRVVSMQTMSGTQQSVALQPGALIFHNGRRATLEQLEGATDVYIMLDISTGAARVVDATTIALRLPLLFFDSSRQTLSLDWGGEVREIPIAPDALLFVDGAAAPFESLRFRDWIEAAMDRQGRITYVQVVR